jgi:hypothetical protein
MGLPASSALVIWALWASPGYRFLAIRELLSQNEFPGMETQLPFPTLRLKEKHFKLFGVVTNQDLAGDKLIWWSRERCSKGEELQSKRSKAVRFGLIHMAGRVVNCSRQQIIRLNGSHPAYSSLLKVRRRLESLWMADDAPVLAPGPP